MSEPLHFSCESLREDGTTAIDARRVSPTAMVIAGWTGRDAAAIEHHIEELEKIGVTRPSAVPLYYRGSTSLLTQASEVEVLGADTSGEAEPVLFFSNGEWWLTVGSDHTDRRVEAYSVAVSKQMCAKPLAGVAWRWSDVASYQDELRLRSRIFENGKWVGYQEGAFAAIRPLVSLRDGHFAKGHAADGSFMFCGTLGALQNNDGVGIRPARQMEIEIHDPRRNHSIVHRYAVNALPVVA
jgi:hypothetical protein